MNTITLSLMFCQRSLAQDQQSISKQPQAHHRPHLCRQGDKPIPQCDPLTPDAART